MNDVRVRFAPSPSGFLHIGGARTALFNYLFAKKRGGKFIVRIDDTDASRSTDASIRSILSDLKWLGLDWDDGPDLITLKDRGPDGPYRASLRKDIYLSYANQLVSNGLAYADPSGAIIFKSCQDSVLTLHDDIRGAITVPPNSIKDFVLIRSSGMATYNFATVIDDHLMKITHVYRADEHLPNTFKQLLLFKAFSWPLPRFGHMSLILASDKSKLSKRHGAASIDDFRSKGYLAPALINFMSLLGWGHPKGKDIFDMDDLISSFSIKKVNVAPAVFDQDKLDWVNSQYIKSLKDFSPYLNNLSIDPGLCLKAIPVFKNYWKTIRDADKDLLKLDPLTLLDRDPDSADVIKSDVFKVVLNGLIKDMDISFLIQDLKSKGISNKDVMWSLRVILLGNPHGPPIDLLTPLFNKALIKKRIQDIQG